MQLGMMGPRTMMLQKPSVSSNFIECSIISVHLKLHAALSQQLFMGVYMHQSESFVYSQRFDDGIQVTPFNLNEEMEEG